MKKILIATNIITFVILVGVLIVEKYPPKKHYKKSIFYLADSFGHVNEFVGNNRYKEQVGFYRIYSGNSNIVMLGNSLVNRISWGELLNRCDVANRGISGDITEGYLHRLNFVLDVKPKICFIEGGINDIINNVNAKVTIKNIDSIVSVLLTNKIVPVLHSITYVTNDYADASNMNLQVKKLNFEIAKLAKQRNITLIDLNPKVSDGNFLIREFAVEDGIHYSAKTYLIWKEEILKVLKKENL
jgi:lysophospholipase L1-like esterase